MPHHKIGQPHLAAGADNKIRVRLPSRIQPAGNVLFGDFFARVFTDKRVDGVGNFRPSAEIDGDVEMLPARYRIAAGGDFFHFFFLQGAEHA